MFKYLIMMILHAPYYIRVNWHCLVKTCAKVWYKNNEDHRVCIIYLYDGTCLDISCSCGKTFFEK